jgi:hypothetical protein
VLSWSNKWFQAERSDRDAGALHLFSSTTVPLTPVFLIVPASILERGTNLRLVVPLLVACFAIMIVVPLAAARSRLHIPGYVGLAFLASILGLICGRISGIRGVAGTSWGVMLSLVFFLLIAFAVGSVLALFFYRDPPDIA